MTEQEIEQARADVDQLDIEQLRCGVMLQLLHIEALKAERDRLQYEVDAIPAIKEERDTWVERHKACVKCLGEALQDASDSFVERDAVAAANQRLAGERDAALEQNTALDARCAKLEAAAKMALDSAVDVYATCDRYGDGDQKAMESLSKAIEALRQAGVQ